MKSQTMIFIMVCIFTASVAKAAPIIVDVALATDVINQEPSGIFNSLATCSSIDNPPTSIPVIDSSIHRKVFLWTKVSSSETFVLRHAYYKDGVEYKTQRTITPVMDKIFQIVDEIKVGLGWKNIADIELQVAKSSGWRTWSSKEIDPVVHRGEWRIQVSPTNDKEDVICVVHFRVK